MGCVIGLGDHAHAVQLRRPATLLPYRGVLRVGARNRAGSLRSGGRTFSSDTPLASPSVRKTFVLRDGRHSKSQFRIILRADVGSPTPTRRGRYRCDPSVCCIRMRGSTHPVDSAAVGRPTGHSPAHFGLVASVAVGDHGAQSVAVCRRTANRPWQPSSPCSSPSVRCGRTTGSRPTRRR